MDLEHPKRRPRRPSSTSFSRATRPKRRSASSRSSAPRRAWASRRPRTSSRALRRRSRRASPRPTLRSSRRSLKRPRRRSPSSDFCLIYRGSGRRLGLPAAARYSFCMSISRRSSIRRWSRGNGKRLLLRQPTPTALLWWDGSHSFPGSSDGWCAPVLWSPSRLWVGVRAGAAVPPESGRGCGYCFAL